MGDVQFTGELFRSVEGGDISDGFDVKQAGPLLDRYHRPISFAVKDEKLIYERGGPRCRWGTAVKCRLPENSRNNPEALHRRHRGVCWNYIPTVFQKFAYVSHSIKSNKKSIAFRAISGIRIKICAPASFYSFMKLCTREILQNA